MSFIILWGTGNPLFGDDGVGPFVVQYLQKKEMEHPICAINCETTPENYIGDLQRRHPDLLLIVDAADMGLPPGSTRQIPFEEIQNATFSTHGLPLDLLLKEKAQEIPIIFIGIQPYSQELGDSLSLPVQNAALELISLLLSGKWEDIPLLYQEKRSPK
ncbi:MULTISPECIES: hydrogenase 3 maturation endopeptidase HyCI [Aminobacterium]|uniref:hydrogenase 3 maturation endopeptidase HyCI n=1 Tax=Aminobacterium TaxID=81466 RepID=UPI00257D8662|nr:hydrogenase 3 maturation endopeptidase HyCI [Aminobacterium sp. UBA4834]